MKNPFPAIFGFLKRIFGWTIKNAPLKEFAQLYFKSIVQATVLQVENGGFTSGAAKRDEAFRVIERAALARGFELEKAGINWLIETAVANLNKLIGE